MNTGESAWSSDGNFWRPRSLDSAPVNAFQKHRKLSAAETHRSTIGLRPDESAALQSLGKEAQAISVPPKKFYDVASAPAKHEHMPGEWLLMQYVLYLRTQSIKAATQIRHSCRNPDLRSRRKLDHLRRLSRIERTRDGSAPRSTLINARPGSSMLTMPPAGVGTSSASLLASPRLATVTGISAEQGSVSSPRSNARRHVNTWLAFTPCARATSATLAPGFSVNFTISSFSETDRHRRTRRPEFISNSSAMSRSLRLTLSTARRGRAYAYELFVPPLSTAANLFCAQIIDHLDCFFWNPIRIKTTSLICIFGDVLLVAAPSGPSTSAFSLRPVFPAGSECNRLSPCFPRHTFLSVHSLVGILNDLLDGLSWMPVSKSDGRL